jgi:hypothetical protein
MKGTAGRKGETRSEKRVDDVPGPGRVDTLRLRLLVVTALVQGFVAVEGT